MSGTSPQEAIKLIEKHPRIACHICGHEMHDLCFLERCEICKQWVCGSYECLAIWRVEGQRVTHCVCSACAVMCSECKQWQYPGDTGKCVQCGKAVCCDCNAMGDEKPWLCVAHFNETVCAFCDKYAPDEVVPCKLCGETACHACRDDFGVCNDCREAQREGMIFSGKGD